MQILKSRKEIAEEFGISTRTLKRWTQKFEIEVPSGLVCPKIQHILKSKIFRDDTRGGGGGIRLMMSDNVRFCPIMSLAG